jgi:hypothetical protein
VGGIYHKVKVAIINELFYPTEYKYEACRSFFKILIKGSFDCTRKT